VTYKVRCDWLNTYFGFQFDRQSWPCMPFAGRQSLFRQPLFRQPLFRQLLFRQQGSGIRPN